MENDVLTPSQTLDKFLGEVGTPRRARAEAYLARARKRDRTLRKYLGWMIDKPLLQVGWVFWVSMFEINGGWHNALDALAFSFCNDYQKPTVWHTMYEATHSQNSPYCGIYPHGAPRNLAEAQKVASDEVATQNSSLTT